MKVGISEIGNLKNANFTLNLNVIKASLRTKIKIYKKRAQEVEYYLSKRPEEWGKFQNEFNSNVDGIFRDIMHFEKINLANGNKDKVYKLKRFFINRIRKPFMRGVYIEWSLRKPFGYAGDFKIIDDIYLNTPSTTGFARLFDNYFQMSAICVAVRNRKEDFKKAIINLINNRQNCSVRIMNLASGSCREAKEIIASNTLVNKDVIFDCYDNDKKAVEFANSLLGYFSNVYIIKKNALRVAATKSVESDTAQKYDFIYSTGLFDYLTYKVSVRLVRNLKKLLKTNGILAISNVRDKYSNPSVHFMEWVGDWNLRYRTDDEFKKLFIDAGFKDNELKIQYEQQGIMQYIFASNKEG
ncbi:MAG: hypothetical protein KAU58_05710 [Candidatus Omnitrophica bacterium]|nr:hypothetical protein [Candidatus Omnitrophota bacterium]